MNSAHWVTERTGIYCKIIANQLILAASLSKRLNHYVPSIWAIRGNTGVGKTEAIAKDSVFKNGLDEEGKLSGILNPDAFKHILKKVHPLSPSTFISNQQVHEEGVALFRSYQNGLKKDALNASTIMDTRFSTIEDIEDNLLIPAKKEQKEVLFLDIEAPLITSLNRVLTRDPFGLDPCPPLADIVKGYKESIIYRKKFLQMVVNDSSIHFYKLYSQNEEGVRQLVAEKRQEIFKVYSKELLDKSTQLCSNKKIESDLNQVITPQYIDQAIKHHDIPEICRFLLESWMDVKIGKAVEMHSLGILPSQASELIKQEIFYIEKYGEISILPFSKTWLEDFPYLFHHLESEHLLHIRGVDEDGRGLHWQTNKFAWRLNPELNPEAKVEEASKGGFQMRLGYFILPLSRIDILKSDSLSNSILNELEIRNEAKELIGYRFFVHPEAYTHYRALHDQNIPFVKPEHSDFIGTPSSAYRSWVIRRIQKRSEHYIAAADSIPFVVKLGVEGKKSNTDKLLTKEMIRKSIDRQMDFDKMSSIDLKPNPEASNLLFFQETFGLILKNIQNYPPCSPCDAEPKDSGMLIREFPNEFLKGRYKIINFSALMSLERLKPENAVVILDNAEMSQLPIIFEVIEAAIKKGEIKTPYAFVEKYLIDGYIKAIEKVFFENKMALLPHAQNLCLALNPDNTPYGFVYRDFEEITDDGIGFIESYSWYYRYHVFIKLLNVITRSESGFTPAPAGAPTQIGYDTPLDERNLNYYLTQNLKNPKSLKKMKELS